MAKNYNPYSTPQLTDAAEVLPPAQSLRRRFRWMTYAAIALGISAVPIYGYFTPSGMDSQNTVLWLVLAWLVTLVNTLILVVRSALQTKNDRLGAIIFAGVSIVLASMLYFGFYGVGHAVEELWAG